MTELTCPHCGESFNIFVTVDHKLPDVEEYLKTANFILHELRRRKNHTLTLKTLRKRCGYIRGRDSAFRKAIDHLLKSALVKREHGGWSSESRNRHPYTIVSYSLDKI